ncbi:hypothetical protein MKW94_014683 [Papaver nudicaule]|uniref:LOB domain-containing protein n=1 Tax=Papaver nudicaule TaxID=74823 RepID=A0AA41V844_PAPNU|nr:hypothetical protein [Papaver nudicaule]
MEKIQIPCVACKSRKIKCSTECPLAPIFTPDRSEDFEAVARVFSAHKFIKLIKEAEPHQQVLAADSLVKEAKARIADPVCGLTGTMYKLSCQLEDLRSELVLTKQENEVHYKQVGTSSSALGASRLLQQLDRLGTNPLLPMPSNERSCGACRYKRQKCLPQCPFAPFFPPNKKEDFQNIVKVYGGANFMKLVNLAEPHKHLAADSMIFEANARISDPVNGLAGIVDTLSQQLDDLTSELSAVRFHAKRTIVQEQKSRKKLHSRSTSAMEASSPAPVTLPFDTVS